MTFSPAHSIAIPRLQADVNGRVIGREDPAYDEARALFYGGFDRRPAVIVRVADATDVSRVVDLARETGLELAVRSGGHSLAGHGVCDGGIVLDLSDMRALDIDVEGRTAWTETGLTAGEYTSAAAAHGLATGFGDTGSVGVGGITLGGGIGYLVRMHGLTTCARRSLDGIGRGEAQTIVEHLQDATAPMSVAQLRVLGGAMAKVPSDATAFGHRRRRIMMNVAGAYDRPEEAAEREAWVTGFAADLPQRDPAAYVGFLGDEGEARILEAYPGSTWDRLTAVKARYDPTNLFHLNENIPPPPVDGASRHGGPVATSRSVPRKVTKETVRALDAHVPCPPTERSTR